MKTKVWRRGVFLFLLAWCTTAAGLRAAPTPVDPLVGNWLYHDNNLVAFHADGTATHVGGGDAGTWQYLRNPEVQRHYRVIWEHGRYVDGLVLSEDAQKARVHNEAGGHGDRYEARRAIADPPAASPQGTAAANELVVGNWLWRGGGTATFNADGTLAAYGMKGTWTFLNNPEVERKYRLVWEGGKFIDEMVCSRDGQQAKVRNQYGDRFDVRRALPDKPAAAPGTPPAKAAVAPAALDPADPILGDWLWAYGRPVTFKADGTVVSPKDPQGVWEPLRASDTERQYRVTWGGGKFVDTLFCTRDAPTGRVVNQGGKQYNVRRGSSAEPSPFGQRPPLSGSQ